MSSERGAARRLALEAVRGEGVRRSSVERGVCPRRGARVSCGRVEEG